MREQPVLVAMTGQGDDVAGVSKADVARRAVAGLLFVLLAALQLLHTFRAGHAFVASSWRRAVL